MKIQHRYTQLIHKLLMVAATGILATGIIGPGIAGIDETLGGLPGNGGGDDLPGQPDRRPSLYIEGTWTEVHGVVLAHTGAEPELVALESGLVRRIFHGNQELILDEFTLQTSEVTFGLLASPIAGAMKASMELDSGVHTALFTVAEGAAFELPYPRLRFTGLFEQPARLHTWNRLHGRSLFEIQRNSGQIRLLARH